MDTSVVFNKQIFKTFEIAFNNALKKILGAPRYSSSHLTAYFCNNLLLKHHVAVIQWRYFQRVFKSQNAIIKLCLTSLKSGYLYRSLTDLFGNIYSIEIEEGGLDIVKARVGWVQNHEERRGVCPFYGVQQYLIYEVFKMVFMSIHYLFF